ncbi:MAG: prepilin-type N-terminal cleavage/methylation domain-containing protein [Chloroflexi bacterium]|nr:prepilin-type N-terminal cleavage/methylation domain-containing protein [Chloroflexota bacterium]
MTRPARGARSGFTLLEVVLAMTSLAMLTAIVYAAFHLGVRAVERGSAAVVTAQRLRAASDVLIRQVKSVDPYCSRTAEDGEYPYFFGDKQSMEFVTAAGQLGGGGLVQVHYRIENDPPQLVLTESTFFSPDTVERDAQRGGERRAVLIDGFRNAQFQYLYRESNESGDDQEMRSEWNAREEGILPAAVQIAIEGLPGLDTDVWGTEIPIMTSQYREGGAECDPERIGEPPPDEAEAAAAGGAAGGVGTGESPGGAGEPDGSDDDEDEDDFEEDE